MQTRSQTSSSIYLNIICQRTYTVGDVTFRAKSKKYSSQFIDVTDFWDVSEWNLNNLEPSQLLDEFLTGRYTL